MHNFSSPIFILSTGRAGSKTLALVLALHPRVISFHEPKPHLSTENFLAWKGKLKGERLERQIRESRDWLVQEATSNNLIYAESSHFLAHLIVPLQTIYQPRFIHIYRDGRDFVRSGLVRPWYQKSDIKSYLARQARRATIQPFGNSIEDHQLQPPPQARSRLEKAAWLWNEVNRNIQNQLRNIPQENIYSLKLEELNQAHLIEILNFLRLEVNAALITEMMQTIQGHPNQSRQPYSLPPKDQWTQELMRSFLRFASEQMVGLDYLTPQEIAQYKTL